MTATSKIRVFIQKKYYQLFFWQRNFFDTLRLRKDLRKKINNTPELKTAKKDLVFLEKSKQFLRENFAGHKNTLWHHYYSTFTHLKNIEFIPSDLFFTTIEPTLNNFDVALGIDDKVVYDLLFGKANLPKTVYKIINNKFYDSKFNSVEKEKAIDFLSQINETIVLKPALFSGGGKNVIIDNAQKIAELLHKNKNYLKGSFVIQKRIKQHEQFARFHPNSVNTCRIMTARVDSEIVVLSSYFRIGRNNSTLDNGQSGGLMCRINDGGKLDKFAYDKNLMKTDKHPDSKIVFKNYTLPFYKNAEEFCLNHHKRFLRFTFISWDIALIADGTPVFIEFNLKRQSIHGHQILNGPLFGKYSAQIINQLNTEFRNKNE